MWETSLRKRTLERLTSPGDFTPGVVVLLIRDEADKNRFGRELPITDRAKGGPRVLSDEGLIFGAHDLRYCLHKAARLAGLEEERAAREQSRFPARRHYAMGEPLEQPRGNCVPRGPSAGHDDQSLRAGPEGARGRGAPRRRERRCRMGHRLRTASGNERASRSVSEAEAYRKCPKSGGLCFLVRKRGLEPPRVLPHRNLNPARLPVPPLPRGGDGVCCGGVGVKVGRLRNGSRPTYIHAVGQHLTVQGHPAKFS